MTPEEYYRWLLIAYDNYTKNRNFKAYDYWKGRFEREIRRMRRIIETHKQIALVDICGPCENKFFVI